MPDEDNETTTDQSEPITLNDFIKTLGVVGTGGQAKMLIQSGEVLVNGLCETRRRRKLRSGDVVELLDIRAVVSQDDDSI